MLPHAFMFCFSWARGCSAHLQGSFARPGLLSSLKVHYIDAASLLARSSAGAMQTSVALTMPAFDEQGPAVAAACCLTTATPVAVESVPRHSHATDTAVESVQRHTQPTAAHLLRSRPAAAALLRAMPCLPHYHLPLLATQLLRAAHADLSRPQVLAPCLRQPR